VVLDERFNVAVEEEVQQMRVFVFKKAIVFLNLRQQCDKSWTEPDILVPKPCLRALASRLGE